MLARATLTALLAVALLVAPTAATPTETPTATPDTPGGDDADGYLFQLDDITRVVSAEYHQNAGVMVVVVEANRPRYVEVADGLGAFAGSGAVRVESQGRMVPKGRTTFRVEVQKVRGMVGVTVGTASATYGISRQTGSSLVGGTPGWGDVQVGALAGGSAALVAVFAVAWRRRTGRGSDVERGPF